MSAANEPARRIVVALDASVHARAAMEAAAELARRFRTDILALFVEDVELVRLAGLPFASEVGRDAEVRPFDVTSLERRFRSDVRQARVACEKAAATARIDVRFEVVRGSVARELLAAAESAEMLVLGRAGSGAIPVGTAMPGRTRRASPLGRTTLSVLGSSTRTVAVVTAPGSLGRPVAVLFDGSDASRVALDLAIRLAGEDHHNLAVLIPAAGERSDALMAEATATAGAAGIVPRFVRLGSGSAAVADAVRERQCRALVIGRAAGVPDGAAVVPLVEALDCPVFVTG